MDLLDYPSFRVTSPLDSSFLSEHRNEPYSFRPILTFYPGSKSGTVEHSVDVFLIGVTTFGDKVIAVLGLGLPSLINHYSGRLICDQHKLNRFLFALLMPSALVLVSPRPCITMDHHE